MLTSNEGYVSAPFLRGRHNPAVQDSFGRPTLGKSQAALFSAECCIFHKQGQAIRHRPYAMRSFRPPVSPSEVLKRPLLSYTPGEGKKINWNSELFCYSVCLL